MSRCGDCKLGCYGQGAFYCEESLGYEQCIDRLQDALYELSADRPLEWIPCSEKLPTIAGHYLCSFKKPNYVDNIYVGLAYWTGGRWYGYVANAINAWMPLPEPWKGEDDETD